VLHSYRVRCRENVQINGLFWIAPAVNLRILDLLYMSTLRVRTCNVKPIIWYGTSRGKALPSNFPPRRSLRVAQLSLFRVLLACQILKIRKR
jgi:hypothetical protein